MLLRFVGLFTFGLSLLAADLNQFEGRWRLDNQQSSSTSPLPQNLEIRIKPEGNQLVLKPTWKGMKGGLYGLALVGITTPEVKLATDGSESTNFDGPYAIKSKTSLDGDRIVTDLTVGIQDAKPITGQWIYTLSPGGKTMTWEVKTGVEQASAAQAKLVFVRR